MGSSLGTLLLHTNTKREFYRCKLCVVSWSLCVRCSCLHPLPFAARLPWMPRVLAGSGFDSRSRCMCGRRTTLQLCSLCYSPLGSRDPARLEPTSTGATDRHHCSLDSSKTSTPYLVLASPADPVEDTINIVPGKNHFIYRLVGVHELPVVDAPTNPSNTKFQSTDS